MQETYTSCQCPKDSKPCLCLTADVQDLGHWDQVGEQDVSISKKRALVIAKKALKKAGIPPEEVFLMKELDKNRVLALFFNKNLQYINHQGAVTPQHKYLLKDKFSFLDPKIHKPFDEDAIKSLFM